MIGIALVMTMTAEFAFRSRLLADFENAYYDLWHRLAGERAQAEHIAIVTMDEATFKAYPGEPVVFWGPYFARAIQRLREIGATAVGLNIIFEIDAQDWFHRHFPDDPRGRMYNSPLLEQLAQGDLILSARLVAQPDGEYEYVFFLKPYLEAIPELAAHVGLANMYTDPDAVVRRFVSAFSDDDLSFGALLAMRAGGLEFSRLPQVAELRRIRFMGPPGTIQPLSFTRLLNPDAADDPVLRQLKGKAVIIAENMDRSRSLHQTPYSRSLFGVGGQWMDGAELHANIAETLLHGKFQAPAPLWARLLYSTTLLLAATAVFFRNPPWKGFGFAVGLMLLAALPAYGLFLADWILPLANAQLAIGMSFLAVLGFRLSGEERDRAYLQQVFGRFVSDKVVDRLVADGKTPQLGGEAQQVTVLFSDIRNFTAISEKLSAQEVVEMLNAYFNHACEPILAHGGMIDKFIGDAVMAVFGAPAPFPDHAQRAIRAALEMKKIAEEFRSWMQTRFPDIDLPEFRIGIGLHSGDAVVGNIGSSKRMEYTVIGDTVNTASRLENATKELNWTIVAGSATIDVARDFASTRGHREIYVKGRGQVVEVFEVVGEKSSGAGKPSGNTPAARVRNGKFQSEIL